MTGKSILSLSKEDPRYRIVSAERGELVAEAALAVLSRFPWRRNIVTTVFWVGEPASWRSPVDNIHSAWDHSWTDTFGGIDNPNPRERLGYRPKHFRPRRSTFYVALPYNDRTRSGVRPEAASIIPWFDAQQAARGVSQVKGRWIAIRKGDKVAYAQWQDVGPFRVDHWQYVFGNSRPLYNVNKSAGMDVSPAVRDYLELANIDMVDWRFVEASEVPQGPWLDFPTDPSPGSPPRLPSPLQDGPRSEDPSNAESGTSSDEHRVVVHPTYSQAAIPASARKVRSRGLSGGYFAYLGDFERRIAEERRPKEQQGSVNSPK